MGARLLLLQVSLYLSVVSNRLRAIRAHADRDDAAAEGKGGR